MEVLALKHVEKTSTIYRKNGFETLQKSFFKIAQEASFIGIQNLPVGGQLSSSDCCRSTGWSTANGRISDCCATGRPAGQPWPGYREQSSLPVDRGHFQRAELSGGRPGRSIGPPAKQAVHVLCTSVDRPIDRPLARSTVRSTGRRPEHRF